MIVDLTRFQFGFGDRLRLITFCATIAKIRKDENLYFKEALNSHCPFYFLDLCYMENFRIQKWQPSHGASEFEVEHLPNPTLVCVPDFKPKDIKLSDEEFLKLWLESYKLIKARPEYQEKINSLNVSQKNIGLHIRRTDKVKFLPKPWDISPLEIPILNYRLKRAIKEESQRNENSKSIFLASDNQKSRDYWEKYLKENDYQVTFNPCDYHPESFRQTSGEDLIVDLFGLSQCKIIIASLPSSFARSAALMAGTNDAIIVLRSLIGRILWRITLKFQSLNEATKPK